MRSITLVQAFQYWLKLTALLAPAAVLLVVWAGDGRPGPAAGSPEPGGSLSWSSPLAESGSMGLYLTYSLIVATFLGTMGLPHVLGRFYTNSDGRAARRSAVLVLAMLGGFYVLVTLLGVLSRVYTPQLLVTGRTDAAVLLLPTAILGSGLLGALVGGLVGLTLHALSYAF